MNKLKYLIAALIIPVAFSQDFDDSFLDSLPEDIQEDVLERVESNSDKEKPSFLRNSIISSELEKKELEDLKKRIEEDLKYLEEKIEDEEDDSLFKELPLFGEDFFKTIQSTFMPINEPNLDSSYVLDSRDVLEIQTIGDDSFIENFPVARDGSITIEEVGKIYVAGLSLEDASSVIKARIENSYIGTSAYVSLVSIRDINVLVSGNAFNPGVYTMSGNSSVLHAVSVAGGINDFGSYREINLIRDENVIETLDLYDVLITGELNFKSRLRTGDIVFVNPTNNIVSIDGAVKRPARYEMLDEQSLGDVFKYANGLKKEADLNNINLERYLDDSVRSIPIVNISQFDEIPAKDGDKILIREHSFRKIKVSGAVINPGTYIMTEGSTIKDVISKAGGYTDSAYPFGAVYENQDALVINKRAKEILYEDFIDNIITLSQQNPDGGFNFTAFIDLTEKLKKTKPNGRMVVDLLDDESSNDIYVKDGDFITIPEQPNHVYVYGEVSSEGAIQFEFDESIEEYINKSGGYKETADKLAVYIMQPNGNTQRYDLQRNLFESQRRNLEIYPGSIIFIPRKIDNSAARRIATQAYVSILGNLGIALASLSNLSD